MDAPPIPNTHLAGVGLGSDGFAFAEAVLAAAPVIVLVLDPRGHIIHYNAFMERLCGRPIAHARGLDWIREFVLEEDRATLLACLAQADVSTRINAIRVADGQTRLIEWHNRLLHDAAGQLTSIVSIGVDITDRVQETAVRLELAERFEQFTAHANEIFFMTDAERQRVLYLSPAFERITNYPRERVYADATRMLDVVHPDDHASILSSLGSTPTGQVEREYRILRPSDTPDAPPELRWLRIRYGATQLSPGERHCVIGVMTDITEVKRTAEQLEQLGRIFRCFDDAIDQIFVLLAPNRRSVIYISRSIERLLGIPYAEFVGNPNFMLDIVHPDDRERMAGLIGRPIDTLSHEFRVIRRDGSVRWLMSRGRVLGPESSMPGALASLLVDVTERHEAELNLRRMTEQLETRVAERTRTIELERSRVEKVLDGMAAYVAILDPEGHILHVNQHLGSRIRHPPLGRHWLDLPLGLSETSRAELARAIAQAGAGCPTRVDIESNNPRGERAITDASFSPLFDEQGVVREIVATSVDVTERRADEQRLRESLAELERNEARLADAQRIAEVGDWAWEVPTDELRWSDGLYTIFGVPRDQPLGLEVFLAAVHPDDRSAVLAEIQRALTSGESYEIEHRVLWPSGEVRHVLGHGEVIRDGSGNTLRMRGTAQDATRRKQVEAQLRASLAEKDALLQEVHHRVKNNLQVVASMLYLEGIHAGSETREVLDECSARIRSMSLVHEQLYMSGRFANIDMREFLAKLAEELAHVFVKGRDLRVAVGGEGLHLDIERAIPVALIANELLTNAFKYAYPEPGPNPAHTAEIRVRVESTMLEIADNGVGLPAGLDVGHASTLGLRLVHMLARQVDARLELGPGPGTCVRLVWDSGG